MYVDLLVALRHLLFCLGLWKTVGKVVLILVLIKVCTWLGIYFYALSKYSYFFMVLQNSSIISFYKLRHKSARGIKYCLRKSIGRVPGWHSQLSVPLLVQFRVVSSRVCAQWGICLNSLSNK